MINTALSWIDQLQLRRLHAVAACPLLPAVMCSQQPQPATSSRKDNKPDLLTAHAWQQQLCKQSADTMYSTCNSRSFETCMLCRLTHKLFCPRSRHDEVPEDCVSTVSATAAKHMCKQTLKHKHCQNICISKDHTYPV